MDAQAAHDLAARVAARFAIVDGVVGIALGGSVASGTSDDVSDVDLGLYYHASDPPSTTRLSAIATEIDDRHLNSTITEFGEWGPWINGGGWLRVDDHKVDILFRDIEKVADVIAECKAGRAQWHYQAGHPHAFLNAIYLAELHYSVILHDRENTLAALKTTVANYPEQLRSTIVRQSLFEARFALENAAKAAARPDTVYVGGCLYRCAASLTQAIFALNSTYLMNEKGSVARSDRLRVRPPKFSAVLRGVMARPGDTAERLLTSIDKLSALTASVEQLWDDARQT